MKPTNKSSRRRFLGNTAAIGAIGAIGASQLIKSCSSGETSTGPVVVPDIPDDNPDGDDRAQEFSADPGADLPSRLGGQAG